jgi:cytochrome c peroxidase
MKKGSIMNGVQAVSRFALLSLIAGACTGVALAQQTGTPDSSYLPVVLKENPAVIQKRMEAEKPEIMTRQLNLLAVRYDLSDRPAIGTTMSRGKPVQGGVRTKLPTGLSWEQLAAMTPEEVKAKDLYPQGFLPLPHPNHPEGGMVFPKFHIDEITTRPDLGDVSHGRIVTIENYFELFNGILNPKQLEGLRLLVTPFPQQQFNLTDDRRSARPSRGVTCFDCHANGHSNGSTHLAPDVRPESFRHRIDTPTLRGIHVQRLFGSQRALKSVEDFTEFEQGGAYFDGDHVIAAKKGVNHLDRSTQVAFMAEFQELLDFPPAPKLKIDGKLDPRLATDAEMRGQQLFFGKASCASCHVPPYYTDNLMHNLKTERFFKSRVINNHTAIGDGTIKTFPLRGIKDTPPYLHDGRLLTLEDTVEFFNLILEVHLDSGEKSDLVAFLRQL